MERSRRLLVGLLGLWLVAGCIEPTDPAEPPATSTSGTPPVGAFSVSSPAFGHAEPIPQRHSCDGENVSPPLDLLDAPATASHFALIMEDPDAPFGTVLHWTFWNLPVNASQLPIAADITSYGADEGRAYRGPCPPAGTHRYFFYAYATNGTVDPDSDMDADALRAALEGRTVARAEMYGTFFRPTVPTPTQDPRT